VVDSAKLNPSVPEAAAEASWVVAPTREALARGWRSTGRTSLWAARLETCAAAGPGGGPRTS
jgi:hypothetical protein